MTTENEINDQLEREDIQPYLNSVYDGHLPESLIEQFRIAIMLLPPAAHKYSMKEVQTMAARRPSEVTVKELGLILNVIYAIAFANMYTTLEEGIEKTMYFDKIREEYNQKTGAFERKIQAKRNRLLKLSGVGGNSIPFNGLSKS